MEVLINASCNVKYPTYPKLTKLIILSHAWTYFKMIQGIISYFNVEFEVLITHQREDISDLYCSLKRNDVLFKQHQVLAAKSQQDITQ